MYSETEILISIITTKVIAGISLLFSAFLIIILLKEGKRFTLVTEVITVIFVIEIIYNIGVLLPTNKDSNNSILCYFQSSLLTISTAFVSVWIPCISHTLLKSITLKLDDFEKKITLYRIQYYLYSIIASIVFLGL